MIEREAVLADSSPLGHTTESARRRRVAGSTEYRRAYEALAVARQVAIQVLDYRLDHGLTQQQLAELTSTSVPQISRIESGIHNPTLKTLQRLADVMGLQLAVSFVDANVEKILEARRTAPPTAEPEVTTGASAVENRPLTVGENDSNPAWTMDFHRAMTGGSGNQRKPSNGSGHTRNVSAA